MTKLTFFSCAILLFFVKNVNSANILGVFYSPSPSHYMLGNALLKEMAIRGHNVTMLSPYSLDKPLNNYMDLSVDGLQNLTDRKFYFKISILI